jgi:hypothetical protein
MQRRYLLLTAPLVPLALFASRLFGVRTSRTLSPADLRLQGLQLDQLASGIHTPEDARRLVDFVAGVFADSLPSAWATRSVRNLTAQAEYLAVTNPERRISEQRIAASWNTYVTTIGVPETSRVNAAEIHNLRDGLFTSARIFWGLDRRNIWAVPSIYAMHPDGSLAPGCRAMESVRILWDLANMPDNLQEARERVQQGLLISDQFRRELDQPSTVSMNSGRVVARVTRNPVAIATSEFIDTNGAKAFGNTVATMLNNLLSSGD